MQRTISDGGHDWLNPALFMFTDAARRKVADMRTAFPDKTPVFAWVTSMRVEHKDGTVEHLGDGLIVGLAAADELPDRALMVSLDGAAIGIEIESDVTTSKAPVIDTGVKGTDRLQFVLR